MSVFFMSICFSIQRQQPVYHGTFHRFDLQDGAVMGFILTIDKMRSQLRI
jgi:hypothetical protein